MIAGRLCCPYPQARGDDARCLILSHASRAKEISNPRAAGVNALAAYQQKLADCFQRSGKELAEYSVVRAWETEREAFTALESYSSSTDRDQLTPDKPELAQPPRVSGGLLMHGGQGQSTCLHGAGHHAGAVRQPTLGELP